MMEVDAVGWFGAGAGAVLVVGLVVSVIRFHLKCEKEILDDRFKWVEQRCSENQQSIWDLRHRLDALDSPKEEK